MKGVLPIIFFVTACFSTSLALADNKVVVVPLFGGAVGDATTSDVIEGKTFSSKAGNGLSGTLKIRDGSTIYTNSIGMEFSLIPAGSFVMGSPDGRNGDGVDTHRPFWPEELGRFYQEKQHIVTLKSFYIQATEVTQGQWEQVMGAGTNPSNFTTCGMDCPVEQVTWYDAKSFITTLNAKEQRPHCFTTPNTCYSLPTESQWEYAARAGTLTAFYNGEITETVLPDTNLGMIGWYFFNTASTSTHPVAQKDPNNWGLYDMSGNVNEWCEDWYGEYLDAPDTDPPGPGEGAFRVTRGGGYSSTPGGARSAYRSYKEPGIPHNSLGFRIALSADQ